MKFSLFISFRYNTVALYVTCKTRRVAYTTQNNVLFNVYYDDPRVFFQYRSQVAKAKKINLVNVNYTR